MKTIRLLAALAALAVTTSACRADESKVGAKDNKLVGVWKLVSAKYDRKEQTKPEGITYLKHVTPTHFIWVRCDKDGKVQSGLGGTCTLNGDKYEETPEYGIGSILSSFKGKLQSFTCKVDGNKWYHSGKLTIGLEIEEVWERVEK
jgi:hypothetical protein